MVDTLGSRGADGRGRCEDAAFLAELWCERQGAPPKRRSDWFGVRCVSARDAPRAGMEEGAGIEAALASRMKGKNRMKGMPGIRPIPRHPRHRRSDRPGPAGPDARGLFTGCPRRSGMRDSIMGLGQLEGSRRGLGAGTAENSGDRRRLDDEPIRRRAEKADRPAGRECETRRGSRPEDSRIRVHHANARHGP